MESRLVDFRKYSSKEKGRAELTLPLNNLHNLIEIRIYLLTFNFTPFSWSVNKIKVTNIYPFTLISGDLESSMSRLAKEAISHSEIPLHVRNKFDVVPYLSKSFWISSALEVVCNASINKSRAFCGERLSAKMAPASLSVLPPP